MYDIEATINMPRLPDDWTWTTLGDVCSPPQYGWTTSARGTGKLKLLRTTDITSGQIDWNQVPFCEVDPPNPEKYLLQPGDVVISRAGSVGFSHLIKSAEPAVFASYLIRFHPVGIDPVYLSYFLKSPAYWEAISEAKLGIAVQNVNATKLKEIQIPLPPLPEQKAIVEIIETQFTRLDAAVAALKRVQANLRRYRAAVLKAACEGRLVPTEAELAQAEGRTYEPAAALLERILAERRAQWQAEHPGKQYKEPAGPDVRALPELPEGWCWATVEQLVDVGTGATPLRSNSDYYSNGTIPWVTSACVNSPFVLTHDELITNKAIDETNAKVFPAGTLLVAMYGEGKTRGKVTELRIAAATNQALAGLVFDGQAEQTRPYLRTFLHHNYEDLRRLSSGGVQPNLNLSIVRSTRIPLPPLAEQFRVTAEVDRYLSLCKNVELTSRQELARTDRLRQSVLNQAFSGQLFTQPPDDSSPY